MDQRTQLANETKSQLKLYFPLALQVLDDDCSTALAADLLLQWPTLDSLQKQSAHKLRKFFYAHNCRQEQKLLERLELIKAAQPLTRDLAVIEPAALRVQLLAQQLKSLLPYIARYEMDPDLVRLFETARPLRPSTLSTDPPNSWFTVRQVHHLSPLKNRFGELGRVACRFESW